MFTRVNMCLRWYLRYPLSYSNLEEMIAERGLKLDHSTVARWVLRYAPVLAERIRSEMRRSNRSWRVHETYYSYSGAMDLFVSSYRFSRQHH
jgi:transposase-like protein